jgi:hypothetical protein
LVITSQGNIGPHLKDANGDQRLWFRNIKGDFFAAKRHSAPPITEQTATQAHGLVLDYAEAIRPKRDAVDTRAVNDVKAGQSRIVDDPDQVGGWPDMLQAAAPTYSNHDGMPDGWEHRHELNPNDTSDGVSDADGDGYTNVEEYLNQTDP